MDVSSEVTHCRSVSFVYIFTVVYVEAVCGHRGFDVV